MSSFAEIYQHESTETKTIPGRTGLLTYTINLREWGYRGPEYLGTCLRGGMLPLPDTSGQFVNHGGHRYRRVGMGEPLELGWLHPRYEDTSPTKLFVRERRGTKERVRQWDLSLREAGDARAETWRRIAGEIGDPAFLVVDTDRPDATYTETRLTAVAWTPAVVVYFGVESQWRADPHGRGVGIYHTTPITHWSPTKTERCPHICLYDPEERTLPFGDDGRHDRVEDPRLVGVDWKTHCEHRLVASQAQVKVTRMASGATRTTATPYEFIYPPVFLSETAGADVAPLDERGTGVYDRWTAQAHARALALLERERKRRGELFRELAEAVFHPARLKKMMDAYGDDWMERV